MSSDTFVVDPERLIRVTYVVADGSEVEVVALVCAYVAVQSADKYVVAIEVVFDPDAQPPHELPSEFYHCVVAQLQRRLLAPKTLKKITPVLVERKETLP